MTKLRTKTAVDGNGEIETQAELMTALAAVSREMLQERELKNACDTELQAIRDQYARDLHDLEQSIAERTDLLAGYFVQHPDLFANGKKSLDLTHAVVGFRTDPPSVKVMKRWTVKSVLEALQARKWKQFIRETLAIDKDAVLAARNDYPAEVLAKVGLEITQSEQFYIEPKLSEQTTAVKQEVS